MKADFSSDELALEVCIPLRKTSPFFFEALASVAAAYVPRLSLLVFENSVEPSCKESDLAIFPGPKRLVCSRASLNIGESWNTVLHLGRKEWLHILHDDDWIDAGFYEAFLRDAENRSPFTLWFCGTRQDGVDGTLGETPGRNLRTADPAEIADAIFTSSRCASTIIHRETALACGGFDVRMRHSLDMDLFWRVAMQGGLCCHEQTLAHYRIHGNSTTGETRKDAQGRLVSLPILDDHRLLNDHLLFLAKQPPHILGLPVVRQFSAKLIWAAFRYYLKRGRLRSLFFWLRCCFAHYYDFLIRARAEDGFP